jgi:hypothetical protein
MSLVRPAGGAVENSWGVPRPDTARSAMARKGGSGRRALRGGSTGARGHAQRGLSRAHGEHAEEQPLEAPEHRGTRKFRPLPVWREFQLS